MSVNAINQVLGPIDLDEFFESFWEQQSLHIERDADGHFQSLLQVTDLESLLSTHVLRFPDVQATQVGQSLAANEYTDTNRTILPNRLLERYEAGATIIFSHAQTLLPALSDFCREMQSFLRLECQTNVYLSPPGRQGFNVHYDTHDVFILQVSGTKTFTLYNGGTELPLTYQKFDAEKLENATVEQTIELSAGDTLYIPRGVAHDALASDTDASLHITLGVYAVTVYDVLQSALQLAAEAKPQLRKSLSRELWTESARAIGSDKLEPVSRMLEYIDANMLRTALDARKDSNALNHAQNAVGLFSRNLKAASITRETVLQINPEAVLALECSDTGCILRTFGQILEFEFHSRKVLEKMFGLGRFTLREIEALIAENSSDEIRVIAEQLLNSGIAVVDSRA